MAASSTSRMVIAALAGALFFAHTVSAQPVYEVLHAFPGLPGNATAKLLETLRIVAVPLA